MSKMTSGNFFRYYNKLSGADRYFLVFPFEKNMYVADLRHLSSSWCFETRESNKNGGWQKWMLQPGKLPKARLAKKAACLMTQKEFEARRKASKQNRGDFCEMLLCEKLGCVPASDVRTARFDRCGDVVYNGLQYQVKYENASLTNVNTLHHAQADARAAKKKA